MDLTGNGSSSGRASDSGGSGGLVVSASPIGRGERERGSVALGRVAGSGVGPGVEDQDDGVIEWAAPGVVFAAGVAVGAAVVLAVAAQASEGGGVAAGFGEEVASVAEHVRPFAQP